MKEEGGGRKRREEERGGRREGRGAPRDRSTATVSRARRAIHSADERADTAAKAKETDNPHRAGGTGEGGGGGEGGDACERALRNGRHVHARVHAHAQLPHKRQPRSKGTAHTAPAAAPASRSADHTGAWNEPTRTEAWNARQPPPPPPSTSNANCGAKSGTKHSRTRRGRSHTPSQLGIVSLQRISQWGSGDRSSLCVCMYVCKYV